MKKYVKPELFYEQFELSQHIADCAWEWKNNTDETRGCYADADPDKIIQIFPGAKYTLFVSEPLCAIFPGDDYYSYCYHPGAEHESLFKS